MSDLADWEVALKAKHVTDQIQFEIETIEAAAKDLTETFLALTDRYGVDQFLAGLCLAQVKYFEARNRPDASLSMAYFLSLNWRGDQYLDELRRQAAEDANQC